MKTNQKKLLKSALVTVMSLVLLVMTACSNGGASGGNEKDENGNYVDKMTVSVASTIQLKEGQLDNEFHQFWMDKYNIDWEYNFIEWDSWGRSFVYGSTPVTCQM